jgi:hypothetical protein
MLSLLNPFLKYVAGGLALVCLVLGVALKIEQRHSAKLSAQLVKCAEVRDNYKRQLDGISTKRNEQQVGTRDRIVEVTRTIKSADERAKVVETAPPPGECKTSQAVLGAGL